MAHKYFSSEASSTRRRSERKMPLRLLGEHLQTLSLPFFIFHLAIALRAFIFPQEQNFLHSFDIFGLQFALFLSLTLRSHFSRS